MLGLFRVALDQLKSRPEKICIDNWVFKLHYRVTVIIFLISTILVTLTEYFGDRMKCISDSSFTRVIETYCFFTSTFTLKEDFDENLVKEGHIAHLGVGPYALGSKKTVRQHHYYQWVPFVLFAQAIMFYLSHLLWKNLEANRLKKLINGLNNSAFAILDKEITVNSQLIPTKENKTKLLNRIKHDFLKLISVNKSWAISLISCELLNVAHVILQVFITHKFLGKEFLHLGSNVLKNGSIILDQVFPKITKCIFYKYGPSGSIQHHDTLCVMGLNIINEKIYLCIWFWFLVLFSASCIILFWRVLCIFCLYKTIWLNQMIFGRQRRENFTSWQINVVVKSFNYPDWLMLKYVAKNIDSLTFQDLFLRIFEELEEKKPFPYGFADEKEKEKFKQTLRKH